MVETLGPNQRCMPCPVCRKTSIIGDPSDPPATNLKKSLSTEYGDQKTPSIPFSKQNSVQLFDENISGPPQGQRNDDQLQIFAQCTSCSHTFCPKCLCHCHPNGICLSREIGDSSMIGKSKSKSRNKEHVAGSKESKRNLRRLCNLNN